MTIERTTIATKISTNEKPLDFFDDFCIYENDINKLEEVKATMESEGLIKIYKNLKTGITPVGFKICFEGGYLDDKVKRERQIKRTFLRNKQEIAFLNKKLQSKKRMNSFLFVLLTACILLIILMILGVINLSFGF